MLEPDLQYIRDQLGVPELLTQLAEECNELGHAALKLRRVYDGRNPTPVSESEALDNLLEEIGDIDNCLEALELNNPKYALQIYQSKTAKIERWAQRLKNREEKG